MIRIIAVTTPDVFSCDKSVNTDAQADHQLKSIKRIVDQYRRIEKPHILRWRGRVVHYPRQARVDIALLITIINDYTPQ